MKILIYNWRDIKNPLGGGAELYVHEIAKRFAQKHKVVFYCSHYDGGEENDELDGIKIIRRGHNFTLYLYAIIDYLRKLRHEDFDLVIDSINCVPFFTPLFIRKPKVTILYHIVKMETISQEIPFPANWVAWLAQRLIPFIYRNVPCVTISASTKADLLQFGIPEKTIAIIHPGVNHTPLTPGAKNSKPLIAYIGVIKKYKQVEHILQVLHLIRNEVPDVEFIIAGKRDYTMLEDTIARLGLESCVKIVGQIQETEKVKILQRAWAFVICSVKEGWGINVIEANACGTLAVAYDVPGLRDSIKNSQTGLLVPYDNRQELALAIIGVLKDAGLRDKLSCNALEWAQHFSWDKAAEDFMSIINREVKAKNEF